MSVVVTWLVLAGFWIGLSGFFDPIHLTFGAISVTIVTLMSHRHLTQDGPVGQGLVRMFRLAGYLPWLLWQIVVANVEVMRCVLGFKPLDPQLVQIRPQMQSDFGRVVLANSITLTPGTVTVEIDRSGAFLVHALTRDAAQGVETGDMIERVRKLEEVA